MNTKELKTRDQIDSKYKWNIEAMIADESVISGELETIEKKPRPTEKTLQDA